jgi:ribosomal protein L14E/L6E/L27E
MKDGKFAVIVEILEPQKAYIADIELSEGDYSTETILYSDIAALIIEIEQPIVI